MITLKQWMELVEYRITEGGEFGWDCYGDRSYQISAWNGVHDTGGWSANITFSSVDQTVFDVEVCDYTNHRAYRIINPDYKEAFKTEATEREELEMQAWDGVDFTDLETDDDWLEKARAIVAGQDYDTRVSIPLDIPDEELLKYMILAHQHDMTFNQFVERALREAIERHKDVLTK